MDPRNQGRAGDGWYLKSLWSALRATTGRWCARADRRRYPQGGRAAAGPGPGGPVLLSDEYGALRCVGCWLCVAACPSDCIQVETRPVAVGRAPVRFEIALDRCRFCGNCADACPVDALAMGPSAPAVAYRRRDLLSVAELSR